MLNGLKTMSSLSVPNLYWKEKNIDKEMIIEMKKSKKEVGEWLGYVANKRSLLGLIETQQS